MSVKTTELQLTTGTVTYRHEFKGGEEKTFTVEFNSLEEMMMCLSVDKMNFYRMNTGAELITVESVGFVAKSEDGRVQSETLLMEDEFYAEVMEKK